jgi:hypothetical protein
MLPGNRREPIRCPEIGGAEPLSRWQGTGLDSAGPSTDDNDNSHTGRTLDNENYLARHPQEIGAVAGVEEVRQCCDV